MEAETYIAKACGCVGPCVQWDELPTTDEGRGICEWCGRAITDTWPAAADLDGTFHYHACTKLPAEGFPHVS